MELKQRHVFRFETDFGSVTALAVRRERLVGKTGIYYDVGFAYCSPQDRGLGHVERRRTALEVCERRLKETPMVFAVCEDDTRQDLAREIAADVEECIVGQVFPEQVKPYHRRDDHKESSFAKWFFYRDPEKGRTFADQFITRYCS